MAFELAQGIDIPDIGGLNDGFSKSTDRDGCYTALLSAEKLKGFINGFTELIPEPIFFFIELPCPHEEEKRLGGGGHYRLYYLDNCTKPVIKAIMKTYGDLLVGDGICRFGFGGNESGDEIYVQSYKVMSIYCSNSRVENGLNKLFKEYGAEFREALTTPWDIISEENSGVCVRAEEDGISLFDLPELLEEAGMYFSETV